MTSSEAGLWRSSRALPKAKLAPKKGHGHCLVVCWLIHYSSLNPSGTTVSEKYAQQIGEMHRHLQQPAASTGQQEGPDASPRQRLTAHRTTDTPKVERTGLQRFASPATFPWLLANQLPLLQASPQRLQGKHFHNQQEAENAFQEFPESWSTDLYSTGIYKLISHWKKYVDCNCSYFD